VYVLLKRMLKPNPRLKLNTAEKRAHDLTDGSDSWDILDNPP
jgi:hypothetical protein